MMNDIIQLVEHLYNILYKTSPSCDQILLEDETSEFNLRYFESCDSTLQIPFPKDLY